MILVRAAPITDPPLVRQRCAERVSSVPRSPTPSCSRNAAAGSIFRSYNLILDQAAERDDLEALVLVHQDAEIADPDFCAKLREALADPEVGVVGCVGAIGVRSIAWWEGSVTWASFIHRYGELGGGEVPAFSWNGATRCPPTRGTGEVDTLDGFVLAPLALGGAEPPLRRVARAELHGYDFDFCLQVREAGSKVVTADFKVDPPSLARPGERPRRLDRGAHAGRREVGGRMPGGRGERATGRSAPAARRPRRRRRGPRRWPSSFRRRHAPRARARARRDHGERQLAADRAAAAAQRDAQACAEAPPA